MTSNFSPGNFEKLESRNSETIIDWGKTIIFAPHPDDESLGCGGAIALLRKYGLPVTVVTMSDGTLSHPNSVKFPSKKLRDLRESEMKTALKILGVGESEIRFLRYSDRAVPGENYLNFTVAVKTIKNILTTENPQTILAPWRFDPHPDHRATWQIVNRANSLLNYSATLIEYPIWLYESAEAKEFPDANDVRMWRLDIEKVADLKQKAIRAHASQITDLIDDDPQGFRLSPEVLEHFAEPFEIYLEEIK